MNGVGTGAMRSQLIEVYAQERQSPAGCSIVVPVYNGTRFLAESIPSILGQAGIGCDIVISDDCSSDGSLDALLALVKAYDGPHSVRVYRTSRPAPSEHVPLLAGVSRTDRIVQAHQDDVSRPDRASVLSAALAGGVKLATSIADIRKAAGVTPPSPGAIEALRRNDRFEAFLRDGQGVMGGARYGMHRDIFDRFPPLSWDRLSGGQDILLHIRAHILGGYKVIYEPLLAIGDHPDRISYTLLDKQSRATFGFDFAMRRLAILTVALDDLKFARAAGAVEPKRARVIARQIRKARRFFVDKLVENRERAILEGYWIAWKKWEPRPW